MGRAAFYSGFSAVALAGAATVIATPAAAQSFNCRSASYSSERAVCASDGLSGLDERMSRLYGKLMAQTDSARGRERLRTYQVRFLAARDACGRDTSCIKGAYLDQIEVLTARMRVAQNERE